MRIVIVAFGTWGDVRPNTALGQALQKVGYEVLLLASEPFRQWVQNHGLGFVGLSMNIQAMMDSISSESTNFLTTLQTLNRVVAPAMLQMGKEIASAVREGDAL